MQLFGAEDVAPLRGAIPEDAVTVGSRYIVGMDYRPGRELVILDIRLSVDASTMRHESIGVLQSALTARAIARTGSSDAVWDDADLMAETGCKIAPESVR